MCMCVGERERERERERARERGRERVKRSTCFALFILPSHIKFLFFSYFKDIYEISGTADLAKKYGDWFTWEGAPRAKIFARNHSDVTDLKSLMQLME